MRSRTVIFAVCLLVVTWTVSAAQETNQAGLVIRFDDARVETYCVSFAEAEITGRMLMDRAALSLEAEEVGMGATVCRIEDVGCPASDCFCDCKGGACTYWSYWTLGDGSWQYSAAGASISQIQHGDVQGWSWGPGSVSEAIAPPVITFEEICEETAAASPEPMVEAPTSVGADNETIAPTAALQNPAAGAGDRGSIPGSYAFLGIVIALLGALTARAYYLRRKP